MMKLQLMVPAAFLLVLCCGCNASHSPEAIELKMFGLLYHEFNSQLFRGPASLEECKEAFPGQNEQMESLYKRIESGEVVVVWNGKLGDADENDNYVLAYDASVPESGGLVLGGGCSIKNLTAEEFKAMPLLPTREPSP